MKFIEQAGRDYWNDHQTVVHTQAIEQEGFGIIAEVIDIEGESTYRILHALNMLNRVVAELKRTTDFLEGICISQGPAAAAFTHQQLERVIRARKVIARAKRG